MFANGDEYSVSKNTLSFERYFTKDNYHLPDFGINFVSRTAHIENLSGEVIFHQDNVIVPDFWSQTATNILAQKYFRKVGVPDLAKHVYETDVPAAFARAIPANAVSRGEDSLRQVAKRLAGHWVYAGFKNGYFNSEAEADIFYDEIRYMLYMQMAAPNSPQFFNTGLYWAYGIKGNENNDHYAGAAHALAAERIEHCYREGDIVKLNNSYEAPQIHACFINRVEDKLVGPNGIMDLWGKEARIFKYGSGSGCNYSAIRGKNEPLSGGGVSSGLISFLKIGDAVGGAIKSGGTTRRAARAVILDDTHPDLLEFIQWKVKEEEKARALIEGSRVVNEVEPEFPLFTSAFEGAAYTTVSGQNANNSVNISDAFMNAVESNGDWTLSNRTNTVNTQDAGYYPRAATVLNEIACAAWKCGDPGLFFGDTINEWNTCLNDERIISTNPCFEYLWFADTACNLASINLLSFYDNNAFDVESFSHAVTLWTAVLDISISMAGYPSEEVAKKSLEYRTLGLGYTNLGALLMVMGVPYDSQEARDISGDITALMTGQAYATSARIAEKLAPFPAHARSKLRMKQVLNKHSEGVFDRPAAFDRRIARAAGRAWDEALKATSYRNAQVTLLAPTGTISLLMDAQTTGVEPDFALVKYKELAGGGNIKFVNQAVERALTNLGYGGCLKEAIINYILNHGTARGCELLSPQNQAIFACANDIMPDGHLGMLAATQPFLSGGISKTINLPNSATVEDVKAVYICAWKLGLKCVSVYRDGCKASQPLTAKKAPPKAQLPSGDADYLGGYFTESFAPPPVPPVFTEQLTPAPEDVKFHGAVTPCATCGHPMSLQIGVCHMCPCCGATNGCS